MREVFSAVTAFFAFCGLHAQDITTTMSDLNKSAADSVVIHLPPQQESAGQMMHSDVMRYSSSLPYAGQEPLKINSAAFSFPKLYDVTGAYAPMTFGGNPFSHDWNSDGIIRKIGDGWLTGSGSYNSYPAMGNIATAGVAYTIPLKNLTVSVGLNGIKYHIGRGVSNNYGFSGSVSYRINDNFTLNVFGSYYFNSKFAGMGAYPYLPTSSYGASLLWQPSGSFGLEMGARRYYDTFSGKWVTMPILAPQVNINGYQFGMDVGGLIYQLLMSVGEAVNGAQPTNPTIAPPMPMRHP